MCIDINDTDITLLEENEIVHLHEDKQCTDVACSEDPDFKTSEKSISTSQLKNAVNILRTAFITENPKALFSLHPVMDAVLDIISKRDKNHKIDEFFSKKC